MTLGREFISIFFGGGVAQVVEQRLFKPWADGSNPSTLKIYRWTAHFRAVHLKVSEMNSAGSNIFLYLRLLILASGVVALDRITKNLVAKSMYIGQSKPFLGDFIHITYVYNPGGAFGTRFGGNIFYIVAAIFAAIILIIWLFKKKHLAVGLTGIALMLGGAAGNLWDRLTVGQVVDFIDVGIKSARWYTFNIADSSITVGICLLILQEIISMRKESSDVSVEAGDENHSSQ